MDAFICPKKQYIVVTKEQFERQTKPRCELNSRAHFLIGGH